MEKNIKLEDVGLEHELTCSEGKTVFFLFEKTSLKKTLLI